MEMYISTYIIDIAALFYLTGLISSGTSMNSYRKKPFLMGIILTIVMIISELMTVFAGNGSINFRGINIFFNVLGFALTPIIPIAISLIIDKSILTTHRLLLVPTFINITATVFSPLFGFIFHIDANNQYQRGPFFFIFIIVYIVNFVFLLISTLDIGKKYNYRIKKKMVALSLFAVIGTSLQIINPLAYSAWHCVTLSLFLYYLLMAEFDSSFDSLTGLFNRASFDKAAKEHVHPNGFSVIILDINDFKIINDTHGHDYGDRVIKSVATIIRESFSKRYTCYRLGGDEFSVISGETDQEKIKLYLKRMTNALAQMREKGKMIPTVSYGYSISKGGKKQDFYKVFKEADNQMYHYKRVHKAKAAQASQTSAIS